MTRLRRRPITECSLAVLAAGAAALVGAADADSSAQQPAKAAEPAVCRVAITEQPEAPLEALRRAELARWQTARTASRQGRKLMRQTMGGSSALQTRRLADRIAQAQDAYHAAVVEARVLCGCRQRRGDPHRKDCDALFGNLRGDGERGGAGVPLSSSSPR